MPSKIYNPELFNSCLPMLKWRFPNAKILFYCHFPQQLVTPTRFFLYRWYSRLIGLIEGLLFQNADLIMVNSHFTGNLCLILAIKIYAMLIEIKVNEENNYFLNLMKISSFSFLDAGKLNYKNFPLNPE